MASSPAGTGRSTRCASRRATASGRPTSRRTSTRSRPGWGSASNATRTTSEATRSRPRRAAHCAASSSTTHVRSRSATSRFASVGRSAGASRPAATATRSAARSPTRGCRPESRSERRSRWTSSASGCAARSPPSRSTTRPANASGAETPGTVPPVASASVAGMSSPLAIRLRGAVKRYGAVTAVAGLDLDVPEGTCVGLLGPNGAGKSTTMKLLTAQAIADEGELEVLGHRLPGDSKAARAVMGVVPQLDNLDTTLTVEQNLLVFTFLYRVPHSDRRDAIEYALGIANLAERRDSRVDELSGGMRRRLLIARALVHQPRLVLLDEPTVGLDPQVRQELFALIDGLRAEGVSILMSTHYIEEAARLADTVTVMARGRAVATGRPTDLVLEHAGHEALEVYGPPARLREVESDAAGRGWATRRTGTAVTILRAEHLDGAAPEGERRPSTLEDVFVPLTGEEVA